MKAFLPLKVAACCVAALFTHFSTPTSEAQVRLAPRGYAGGLVISLTTNGFKFVLPSASTAQPSDLADTLPPIRTRESFAASVMLSNRSNSDITFTFPDANAAATRFVFRVLNSADDVIWESEQPSLIPVAETNAILGKRRTWQRTVQVPLKTNETTWLEPGRYTLEALVNGAPSPGASTVFEVVLQNPPPPPPPPEDNQGIEGVVFQRYGDIAIPEVLPQPVKANYSIEEIVPPHLDRVGFVWHGVTDDQGKFHVMTPPGVFKVSASRVPLPGDPTSPPTTTTIQVSVNAGAFAKVAIYLPPDRFHPPPPADSGIRGLVLAPPGGPAAPEPLANAPVTVDEITDVVVGRPRFRWTGKTDANGKFQVATYPGRYRITARQFETFTATAEVTVKEHAYTDVQLIIENALVGPVAP